MSADKPQPQAPQPTYGSGSAAYSTGVQIPYGYPSGSDGPPQGYVVDPDGARSSDLASSSGYALSSPSAPPGAYYPPSGAVPQCRMTRPELENHLTRSDHGSREHIFKCYFRWQYEGGPPVCITCGQQIGQHEAPVVGVATTGAVGSVDGPMAFERRASTPEVVRIDPNALPTKMKRNETVDTFEVPPSMCATIFVIAMFCAGVVIITAFGASGLLSDNPYMVFAPSILILLAVVPSIANTKRTIVFDHTAKTFRYEARPVPFFCCCASTVNGNFSEIETAVMASKKSSSSRSGGGLNLYVWLALRNGERLELEEVDLSQPRWSDVENQWKVYVESKLR